jgi:hypothetical protein
MLCGVRVHEVEEVLLLLREGLARQHLCYRDVTEVLQGCYRGVTAVLHWCYNGFTVV